MSLEKTKEVLVLDYFLTREQNSVKEISLYFDLSESRVHAILNTYLNNK